MKVTLFSYSQKEPQRGEASLSVQDQIAYCARVSNPSNQMNLETVPKLIAYLIKNKHWSPFEMASATLEIVTTRDIARQILRHRSFSFQEFSQRYADVTQLSQEFVMREARLQDTKNRQNSLEITEDNLLKKRWEQWQERIAAQSKDAYIWALEHGIAKEQARAVLPEGLTQSKLYMSGTIRSWMHYIDLRTANGTQKEHREVAIACADAIEPIFPLIKEFNHHAT